MINIKKGDTTPVKDQQFTIGLGWKSPVGSKFDLDVSIFMLNTNKVIPTEEHFVFYGNTKSPCNTVLHSGDCQDGDKSEDCDDETLTIDLAKVTPDIVEMIIVVTIHEGVERSQNFGMIKDAYIRIINTAGQVDTNYNLDENFAIETGVLFGRLIKINNNWSFEAMGIADRVSLADYLSMYFTGIIHK